MSIHAKLFTSEKFGQILLRKDTNEEGSPCVCVTAEVASFGGSMATFTFSFGDTDEGWKNRDEVFEKATLEDCEGILNDNLKGL